MCLVYTVVAYLRLWPDLWESGRPILSAGQKPQRLQWLVTVYFSFCIMWPMLRFACSSFSSYFCKTSCPSHEQGQPFKTYITFKINPDSPDLHWLNNNQTQSLQGWIWTLILFYCRPKVIWALEIYLGTKLGFGCVHKHIYQKVRCYFPFSFLSTSTNAFTFFLRTSHWQAGAQGLKKEYWLIIKVVW